MFHLPKTTHHMIFPTTTTFFFRVFRLSCHLFPNLPTQKPTKMFANALRMQARLALLTARSVAVRPATTALRMPLQIRLGGAVVGASRTLSTTRVQRYEVPSAPPRNPPAKTVWIGNLPFFVSEEEVREKFAPYGPISSIRLSAFSLFFPLALSLPYSSRISSPSPQAHTHPPPYRHRPRRPLKRLRTHRIRVPRRRRRSRRIGVGGALPPRRP